MLSSFSVLNCIVNHCTSSWEDLTAAPPGSPLAFPLIYTLIHLYCCHMASLSLTPPSPTPSIIPLFLPPLSHISELLILGASQSKHAPQFPVRSSLPPSFLLFFSLLSVFPTSPPLLQQGPFAPSPVLQFTPKVSTDPILPPSAIDASLSELLGFCVVQTRPKVECAEQRKGAFPRITKQLTFKFIFTVS